MEQLTGRLISLTWEDLAPETVLAAKRTLLDTLGAIIFGNGEAENLKYAKLVSGEAPGKIGVIGTPYRLGLGEAAFVNGCGSVATEMDEGNQWSKGHPAAHCIPALLTYVQTMKNCPGTEFLAALVGGYEASSRFGRAVTLLPEAHAHGTWGTAGAAAGVMLLARAAGNAGEFVEGLQLAASFALPTMWSAALEGALVRNAYAGHASQTGVRTAALLQAGFRAPHDAAGYVYGRVLGSRFDTEALHSGEEDGKWDIERNYFKPYAFCRYAHAPLDAFGELADRHSLRMDDIAKVEVLTYRRAATLDNQEPDNVLSAKFSIPYALAVRLASGRADQDSFAGEWLANERIRAFAKRVEVRFAEELERNYPTDMPAQLRVILTSGDCLESRCDMARGGPGRALSEEELAEKFKALTKRALTAGQQERVIDFVRNLEQQANMADLIGLYMSEPVQEAI